jgi:hypothetical protein
MPFFFGRNNVSGGNSGRSNGNGSSSIGAKEQAELAKLLRKGAALTPAETQRVQALMQQQLIQPGSTPASPALVSRVDAARLAASDAIAQAQAAADAQLARHEQAAAATRALTRSTAAAQTADGRLPPAAPATAGQAPSLLAGGASEFLPVLDAAWAKASSEPAEPSDPSGSRERAAEDAEARAVAAAVEAWVDDEPAPPLGDSAAAPCVQDSSLPRRRSRSRGRGASVSPTVRTCSLGEESQHTQHAAVCP